MAEEVKVLRQFSVLLSSLLWYVVGYNMYNTVCFDYIQFVMQIIIGNLIGKLQDWAQKDNNYDNHDNNDKAAFKGPRQGVQNS